MLWLFNPHNSIDGAELNCFASRMEKESNDGWNECVHKFLIFFYWNGNDQVSAAENAMGEKGKFLKFIYQWKTFLINFE